MPYQVTHATRTRTQPIRNSQCALGCHTGLKKHKRVSCSIHSSYMLQLTEDVKREQALYVSLFKVSTTCYVSAI